MELKGYLYQRKWTEIAYDIEWETDKLWLSRHSQPVIDTWINLPRTLGTPLLRHRNSSSINLSETSSLIYGHLAIWILPSSRHNSTYQRVEFYRTAQCAAVALELKLFENSENRLRTIIMFTLAICWPSWAACHLQKTKPGQTLAKCALSRTIA